MSSKVYSMKIVTVVGARPNFMKVAPIVAAINRHNAGGAPPLVQHVLVHTGQHYDQAMSGAFFSDLELSRPDISLGVGSGSHAVQTAEIMKKFEEVLLAETPDVIIVVGDVNSTVGCALVAAKIPCAAALRPTIVHVEAGLRSFDRTMPEEINRIVTDHLADVLFVTEPSGLRNLSAEGIPADKVHFVGNTMIDSLLAFKDKAESSTMLEQLGLRKSAGSPAAPYALLTLHRPNNVDDRESFLNILTGLEELSRELPIIFPVHPRTRHRIQEFGLASQLITQAAESDDRRAQRGVTLIDPLGYLDFVCMMKHARLVVTDSGGIQEETTCLGIPCVTVRENTERPVTVESGTNLIAGTGVDGVRAAIRTQMARTDSGTAPEKWDGHAAARILEVLIREQEKRSAPPQSQVLHEVCA